MEQERDRLTVWAFLKGLFKVVVGFSLLVQSLLFLVLFVFVIGFVSNISRTLSGKGDSDYAIRIEEGSALYLNPEGMLVETAPPADPFEQALAYTFFGVQPDSRVSVHEIVRVIRTAKNDDRIDALVINVQGLYIPQVYASKAHYIASEIEKFRESGKPVVAVGDAFSQEQYLIASEADTVFLHDMGAIFFEGYGAYRTYVGEALDKLKVTRNVFRVGTYKSALEPFSRNDMSPEAKQANRAYLDAMWSTYVGAVEDNRELPAGSLEAFVNDMPAQIAASGNNWAAALKEAGLVDRVGGRPEQLTYISSLVRRGRGDDPYVGVSYETYLLSVPDVEDDEDVPNVAVITAAGTIVDGDFADSGVASSGYISRQLRAAVRRDDIKAVVLRIDSPGGSTFASEVIRDEILNLKKRGKPVIVSMGSLAASGGYWIAADADEIIAAPTTLTGSIGVFGFIPTFENLAEELGVSTDGVGTTPYSSVRAIGIGAMPDDFKALLQQMVDATYVDFLALVAEGRDMNTAAVDEIAQGRVWIGDTAQQLRLVDRLGTIDDAINIAADRAGLDEYDVIGLTRKKSRLELFLESLTGAEHYEAATEAALYGSKRHPGISLKKLADIALDEVKLLSSFNDPNGLYVRCLECMPR